MRPCLSAAFFALLFLVAACGPAETTREMPAEFELIEATIADIHRVYRAGALTARELTERYLARIEADDKAGDLAYFVNEAPASDCPNIFTRPQNVRLRDTLLYVMESLQLAAIIYPTWSNPPRKVGDLDSPAGDNSQILSPHTGFPAITVPMGFTGGRWPAGLTFLGRLFDEPKLIGYTYAYEQQTRHRLPPEAYPAMNRRASEPTNPEQ